MPESTPGVVLELLLEQPAVRAKIEAEIRRRRVMVATAYRTLVAASSRNAEHEVTKR
jgi:hypothetical protein